MPVSTATRDRVPQARLWLLCHPRRCGRDSPLSQDQDRKQSDNLARHSAQLLPLLKDSATLDVVVNADASLWVNKLGIGFKHVGDFPVRSAKLLLAGIATMRRIAFDEHHPILETVFPLTGNRIEGLISPVVTGAVLAIRTRQKQLFPLEDLARASVLSCRQDPLNARRHHDTFFEQARGLDHLGVIQLAARYRRNMLLVGPTGSGKTTFGNSIIAEWRNTPPAIGSSLSKILRSCNAACQITCSYSRRRMYHRRNCSLSAPRPQSLCRCTRARGAGSRVRP